jgi:hypothetical protein
MPSLGWLDTGASVFSAVGTVGAFAIGMVLLRQEHKREEQLNEERRRSQAVKVSAWLEDRATRLGDRELWFHVHNGSDMPIFEVSLPMPIPTGDDDEAEFIALVPPGQTIQRRAPEDWVNSYFSPEPVQIEFLDSSGWRWSRDEQGSLVKDDSKSAGPGSERR